MNTKATKQGRPAFRMLVGRLSHALRARVRALRIFLMPNFAQLIVYNILIPLQSYIASKHIMGKLDANADVTRSISAIYVF